MTDTSPSFAHTQVEALFDRLAARDVDGFLALFADDGRQVLPYAPEGFPTAFEGRAALDAAYRQLFGNYARVAFVDLTIEEMRDPSRLLATYGTDIDFKDGRHYANRYIATFTVRADGIAEWVEYFDPIRLAAQLGDVFAPPMAEASS